MARVTKEDIPAEEVTEMSKEMAHNIQKDVRRDKRASRKIPSREHCERDYCGATFHVSKRNAGRKPRSKDHR